MMGKTGKKTGKEPRTLTPRRLEILKLIRDYRRVHGYSPTLQEIADELRISKITVFEHVEALERKGLLTRHANRARSLEVSPDAEFPDERPSVVPLVGRIAAGKPLEAIENPESVDLEAIFQSRHPVRALTVVGDSMIGDRICSGDIVVYEERSNARNGDTVVAIVDDDEATLKRFYKEKTRIRLQPANDKYDPIYSKNVKIQGIVIGVLRRF